MLRSTVVVLALALCSPLSAQMDFEFICGDMTVEYDVSTGEGTGSTNLSILENPSPGFPHNVQGWAMAVAHDPAVLTAIAVEQGAYMLEIDPLYFSPVVLPEGITIACVYSATSVVTCTYEIMKEVVIVEYETKAPAFAGDVDGDTSAFEWIPLGSPTVEIVVVVDGTSSPTTTIPGFVHFVPTISTFARGDANGDQNLDVSDPIFLANALFVAPADIPCLDAADANDDGVINIADVVFVPSHLFASGPPPPAPFGFCGDDPTADELDCQESNCP